MDACTYLFHILDLFQQLITFVFALMEHLDGDGEVLRCDIGEDMPHDDIWHRVGSLTVNKAAKKLLVAPSFVFQFDKEVVVPIVIIDTSGSGCHPVMIKTFFYLVEYKQTI